jgi:hypothetical protein
MPNPQNIFPPELLARWKRDLEEAEKSLDLAKQRLQILTVAGVAPGQQIADIAETERKIAQLKAAFQF